MKVDIGPYPKNGRRRKSIRIDRQDIWSLDHTLALIITPALKRFKARKAGYPGSFFDHESMNGLSGKKRVQVQTAEDLKASATWNAILDKMIWSFDQVAKNRPDEPIPMGKDTLVYRRESKAYDKRMQAGLRLFADYYGSLWT